MYFMLSPIFKPNRKAHDIGRKHHLMNSRFLILAIASCLIGFSRANQRPDEYAVKVTVSVQEAPPRIILTWPSYTGAKYSTVSGTGGFLVSRKLKADTAWGTPVPLLDTDTSYMDTSVSRGVVYEYQVKRVTTSYPTPEPGQSTVNLVTGYGYVAAGVRVPAVEKRGKVLVIVEYKYGPSGGASSLVTQLNGLQADLEMDGWTVQRIYLANGASVADTKTAIVNAYNADPTNTKSVLLFGHVPVPRSGDIVPDLHGNHQGAWVADLYYADIDGSWTDSTVNDTSSEFPSVKNTFPDGKFDQSSIPSGGSPANNRVELQVGRVDFEDLTFFKTGTETDADATRRLLIDYLVKDHNFRIGAFQTQRKALMADREGERGGSAPMAQGWRHFTPFFGSAGIDDVTTYGSSDNSAINFGSYAFEPANSNPVGTPYLWSEVTSTGDFTLCDDVTDGIDSSSQVFKRNRLKAVFTSWLLSYAGDWYLPEKVDNYLRSSIASTNYALVAFWGGRPIWPLQQMAMGETIGYAAQLAQNNTEFGLYQNTHNSFAGLTHVSLLGDPTLRMHVIRPATGVSVSLAARGQVNVTWTASPDINFANIDDGYIVYRASSANGPWTRLGSLAPVRSHGYVDFPPNGTYYYLVKATKMEGKSTASFSGTYQNLSLGAKTGSVLVNNVPTWSLTIVPTFGGFYSSMAAVNINQVGAGGAHETTLSYDGLNYAWHALRYTTANQRLGNLYAFSENTYSTGINDSTEVSGYQVSSPTAIAVRWNAAGAATALQSLGGSAYANDINNSGLTVGHAYFSTGSIFHAVKWAGGSTVVTDLGSLVTGGKSSAQGVNAAGRICGYAWNANNKNRAFLLAASATGITTGSDLGTMANFPDQAQCASVANDVNDFDVVVGTTTIPSGETHGYFKDGNSGANVGFWDLDTLGGTSSTADAVSNTGWVVGVATDAATNYRAAIRPANGSKFVDFNTFLPAGSNIELREAYDVTVTSGGQVTVVGWGYVNGESRGFIMKQN